MNRRDAWTFGADELPKWARADRRRTASAPDAESDSARFPAPTPVASATLLARLLGYRVAVAGAFLALAYAGHALVLADHLLHAIIAALLIGTVWGVMNLAYAYYCHLRTSEMREQGFQLKSTADDLALSTVLYPMLGFPILVATAWLVYLLFQNRFLGMAVLVPAALLAAARFAGAPVAFAESLARLPDPWQDAREPPSGSLPISPLPVIALVLLAAWLVPAATSNAAGLVAVTLICSTAILWCIAPLRKHAPLHVVWAALLVRGECALREYLDYEPTHPLHWSPAEAKSVRRRKLLIWICLVDASLLVGLGFYCPWEPFAAHTVSGFETGWMYRPQYAADEFRWLLAPLALSDQAQPKLIYQASFAIAVLAFIMLPTLVHLAAFLPQVVALETRAQTRKRMDQAERG